MTSTGHKGNHRSKKKRIALVLAPAIASAMAASLMSQASAATKEDVERNCKDDSGGIKKCEFVDVQFQPNNYGPNEVVSTETNNCGEQFGEVRVTFSWNTSVTRIVQLNDGFAADVSASIGGSLLTVGAKYATFQYDIKRDETAKTDSGKISGIVKPNHTGYIMWSAKRTDVSGYLKATYKSGDVSFSPSEGGTGVHVFYPQILKTGEADGRIWLRNTPCPTPAPADKSGSGGGVSFGSGGESTVSDTVGFGEGGPGVIDVEIQR